VVGKGFSYTSPCTPCRARPLGVVGPGIDPVPTVQHSLGCGPWADY